MLFFSKKEYILFKITGFIATGIVNKYKIHTLVFLFQKEILKDELFEFRQGRKGPYSLELENYFSNQDYFEYMDEYGLFIRMKNYGYRLIIEHKDEFSEYNEIIKQFLYEYSIVEWNKLKEITERKYPKYYPTNLNIF
jgi:hypothetical protein